MQSRYVDADARAAVERWGAHGEDLALRVYTSRLLGQDASLVLHGGGNTSVKSTLREITGEETQVLYVKGSGWDLANIEPSGFPACRMAPLLRCARLERLSDEDMVKALRSQMLDPSSPTPSVEALLHALLPGKFVDHTHADAVLAIVDQPDSALLAKDVWGAHVLLLPYVMPGFVLARRVAELGDRVNSGNVLVLERHGIFTWGETARESYGHMIEAVSRAEHHVARARTRTTNVGMPGEPSRRERQRRLGPIVRGALQRANDGARFILDWRDEPEILELLSRPDAHDLTQIGPMTPDHVLRTKPVPAWLGQISENDERTRAEVEGEFARFGAAYVAYFDANTSRSSARLTRLDRLPRILLVPGLGALTIGRTLDEAKIAGDIYVHTAGVILDAMSIGRYEPVSLANLFDVEYWSLEQAKIKVARAPGGSLSRHIALVTGAGRGIGRATAAHFVELGAHVVISDADTAALDETLVVLGKRAGTRLATLAADVTNPSDVRRMIDECVARFGGLDVVVSNAGNAPSGQLQTEAGENALLRSLQLNLLSHQYVARAASEVFLAQGIGGCLLFNASKSAFNPGKDFGPYAVPKAGVIALMRQYAVDLGSHGIRANAVNADRIRTALFDGIVESRARARGVSPAEYFRGNLLGRETTAQDVAEAFGWLATADATTGAVVTVDGGNPAAFPR